MAPRHAAFELPEEVLAMVLSRLSVPELGRSACVSRAWRRAASSPELWRAAFLRLLGPAAAAAVARRALLAGGVPDWRQAAADRHRAGVGWRDGRCRVTTLDATNREAGLFKIVDDHLISCDNDGSLTVRCLERRAGGQRRPARLRRHRMPVCACDSCPHAGLVLTSAEDGSVALWRSAAAMATRGETAQLAQLCLEADGACGHAWLLPPPHLQRLRAGPLYRLRRGDAAADEAGLAGEADAAAEAAALDDEAPPASARGPGAEPAVPSAAELTAARAWRGPSALAVLVSRSVDSAPQCATATLWEFPLPASPPFSAGPLTAADVAAMDDLPPPSRVAVWRDVFVGPPPPENANEAAEDDRVGVIGPTMCKVSAMLAVLTSDGGLALRDLCTGDELQPEALRGVRAAQMRNVVCDEHAGTGARQMLLESREQQMTVIDVETEARVVRFQLPRQQLPLMYSDRVAAWLPPASRFLVTGEVVPLPSYGRVANDANTLRVATRRDGAGVVADRAAEAAAAAAAREAPWLDPPVVVLYRLWDCVRGHVAARVALPALRGDAEGGPLAWNGNMITLDALTPGSDVLTALVIAPEAASVRGRTAGVLQLWRSDDGTTTKLPEGAALQPRHAHMHAQPHAQPVPEIHMMPGVHDFDGPGLFVANANADWAAAAAALEMFLPMPLGAPPPPPPFQLGLTEAVSWRWAVIAEYSAGGNALQAPGTLTVLDMLGGGSSHG